jgi:hypothetical protein
MRLPLLAALLAAALITAPEAKTQRSYAVKAEFKRLNPCPANGNRRGPCPGYEVDHVIPLKCNGPDAVENLQWLTVEEHKLKTKREAGMCRR